MKYREALEQIRSKASSEQRKGEMFEYLMQNFLKTYPLYSELFEEVWRWNEFPYRSQFGGSDLGIDLVARTVQGEYWAIQCKLYAEEAYISKPIVDTFLSTSSRRFATVEGSEPQTAFAQRLWISTTSNWNTNATQTIQNQTPPVLSLGPTELEAAPVDWSKLLEGIIGEKARRTARELFAHQRQALQAVANHFQSADRGKLIMACGTGKTLTALRIAEELTTQEGSSQGLVLFLVPSLALLQQTLLAWFDDAKAQLRSICVCSDASIRNKASKNVDENFVTLSDLPHPACTDVESITVQLHTALNLPNTLTVVFSTYHSIQVVSQAQELYRQNTGKEALFDLIICDEAHRTTGVTLADEDESTFVKVHDPQFIKAKKRLYMTATPRLYSESSKAKAEEMEAVLCSMDDTQLYGEVIYRLGFGDAVERNLLSDYKVLVLTISEEDFPPALQAVIADPANEISADDSSKLIGCISALSKEIMGDSGALLKDDTEPMRTAVAFCQSIRISKKITEAFNSLNEEWQSLPRSDSRRLISVTAGHVDGAMNAMERASKLSWLKAAPKETQNQCRILTNVRCLSEGVDVPTLDAVLFLSPRNSQVDVVQSVGRVMRKAPGKKYGYIIIPVVVPANAKPEEVLSNNKNFAVVWSVLNALRSHDDRFNAIVNHLDLNRHKPEQLLVGKPNYDELREPTDELSSDLSSELAERLRKGFTEFSSIFYARVVDKVGDRRYWEAWARDVADIAQKHISRIDRLVHRQGTHRDSFADFMVGLHKNINPSVSEAEAIEMLAQHLITRPVFEALFGQDPFVHHQSVSRTIQDMIDLLEDQNLPQETESLQKFYDSVQKRAQGIDNAEGKQKVVLELYDSFFRTAFPKLSDRLGIVYTPLEVVDFMLHSVEALLRQEFDRSISDEDIHILDPFTGTGTFIVRLLQSGLIRQRDLYRKYSEELHANEIVLLAYYIAAVNIAYTYQERSKSFTPFQGICLTDTFQMNERGSREDLVSHFFPMNSVHLDRQRKKPITVILGNPPYSVGQKATNDASQNQSYPDLEDRISATYAAQSSATLQRNLYDSYIKAFRWASDRLNSHPEGGVIAFVTNGGWLEGNAMDGFRKCLAEEFSSIYVFNLKGDGRTSGERCRREGEPLFAAHGGRGGSLAGITVSFLVKKREKSGPARIHYHDIGDYLKRKDKLSLIKEYGSIASPQMEWQPITPNSHGDWIEHRSEAFATLIPLDAKKKLDSTTKSFFLTHSAGTVSSRDAWVYQFSEETLRANIRKTIAYYEEEREKLSKGITNEIQIDSIRGSWSRDWKNRIRKNRPVIENSQEYRKTLYRPFCLQQTYFEDDLNEERGLLPQFFPTAKQSNLLICVSGIGNKKPFSVLITNQIPDFQLQFNGQCFPLYYYERRKKSEGEPAELELAPKVQGSLPGFGVEPAADDSGWIQRDALSPFILQEARSRYGGEVSSEALFYYVYGLLHSEDYRKQFATNFSKELPRLPLVERREEFEAFSQAGRRLARLHLNYESPESSGLTLPEGVSVRMSEGNSNFRVEKMRFPSENDQSTIIYNEDIRIEGIPPEAYDYTVNGKSPIEWVMERYQVTVHKASQIRKDPNDWLREQGKPRYILDLLLNLIAMSLETLKIVRSLPGLTFEEPPTTEETESVETE